MSSQVLRCSIHARLLFIALLTQCEDNGVCEDDPSYFRRFVFSDDSVSNDAVNSYLAELHHVGLVQRYEVGGTKLLYVTGWDSHQKVNRPSPASFPRPGEAHGALSERSVRTHGALTPRARASERSGAERKGASAPGAPARSSEHANPIPEDEHDPAPARPPLASLAPAAPAAPGNNAPAEIADLVDELATLLEARPGATKRGSQRRRDVIARRIREIGTQPVERAIRWIVSSPDPEAVRLFGLAARHEDALAVKGDVDRIEEALRRAGRDDRDEPEDAAPVAPVGDAMGSLRSLVLECWIRSCWLRKKPIEIDLGTPEPWRNAFKALIAEASVEVAIEAATALHGEDDLLLGWTADPNRASAKVLRGLAERRIGGKAGETRPRTAPRPPKVHEADSRASSAVGGNAA